MDRELTPLTPLDPRGDYRPQRFAHRAHLMYVEELDHLVRQFEQAAEQRGFWCGWWSGLVLSPAFVWFGINLVMNLVP